MKHNIKHLIVAGSVCFCMTAATPLLSSCSDYLDKEPDTELTTEMAFDNRDKVYSWLSYVYNIIHTPDKWELKADGYDTPLVADVHFTAHTADVAALYCEKVRINPGNYVDPGRTFKHL